jgi:hypothetical protein
LASTISFLACGPRARPSVFAGFFFLGAFFLFFLELFSNRGLDRFRLAADSFFGVAASRSRIRRIAVAVGCFKVDDVAQQHFAVFKRLVPGHDRLNGQRAFADAADHHVAAGFDAFCDGDFAFAGQKFNRTHFAQVHAHGVIRAAEVGFGKIAGAFFVIIVIGFFLFVAFFLGVRFIFDQVDADIGQHRHGFVDLVRRVFAGRQSFVQLVISEIAAFLALGDDLLDHLRQSTALHRTVIGIIGNFNFLIFVCFRHHEPVLLLKNLLAVRPFSSVTVQARDYKLPATPAAQFRAADRALQNLREDTMTCQKLHRESCHTPFD